MENDLYMSTTLHPYSEPKPPATGWLSYSTMVKASIIIFGIVLPIIIVVSTVLAVHFTKHSKNSDDIPLLHHCFKPVNETCTFQHLSESCSTGESTDDPTCGNKFPKAKQHDCYKCVVKGCEQTRSNVFVCDNHEFSDKSSCEKLCSNPSPDNSLNIILHNRCSETSVYSGVNIGHTCYICTDDKKLDCKPDPSWKPGDTCTGAKQSARGISDEARSAPYDGEPFNGVALDQNGSAATNVYLSELGGVKQDSFGFNKTFNGVIQAKLGCTKKSDGTWDCTDSDCPCPSSASAQTCPAANYGAVANNCTQVEFNTDGGKNNYNVSSVNAYSTTWKFFPDPKLKCVGDCKASGGGNTKSYKAIKAGCPEHSTDGSRSGKCISGRSSEKYPSYFQVFIPSNINSDPSCSGIGAVTYQQAWACSGALSGESTCCAALNRKTGFNVYYDYLKKMIPLSYTFPYDDSGGQSGFSSGRASRFYLTSCPIPLNGLDNVVPII
jgi:hypothetical protein